MLQNIGYSPSCNHARLRAQTPSTTLEQLITVRTRRRAPRGCQNARSIPGALSRSTTRAPLGPCCMSDSCGARQNRCFISQASHAGHAGRILSGAPEHLFYFASKPRWPCRSPSSNLACDSSRHEYRGDEVIAHGEPPDRLAMQVVYPVLCLGARFTLDRSAVPASRRSPPVRRRRPAAGRRPPAAVPHDGCGGTPPARCDRSRRSPSRVLPRFNPLRTEAAHGLAIPLPGRGPDLASL